MLHIRLAELCLKRSLILESLEVVFGLLFDIIHFGCDYLGQRDPANRDRLPVGLMERRAESLSLVETVVLVLLSCGSPSLVEKVSLSTFTPNCIISETGGRNGATGVQPAGVSRSVGEGGPQVALPLPFFSFNFIKFSASTKILIFIDLSGMTFREGRRKSECALN